MPQREALLPGTSQKQETLKFLGSAYSCLHVLIWLSSSSPAVGSLNLVRSFQSGLRQIFTKRTDCVSELFGFFLKGCSNLCVTLQFCESKELLLMFICQRVYILT